MRKHTKQNQMQKHCRKQKDTKKCKNERKETCIFVSFCRRRVEKEQEGIIMQGSNKKFYFADYCVFCIIIFLHETPGYPTTTGLYFRQKEKYPEENIILPVCLLTLLNSLIDGKVFSISLTFWLMTE